MRRILVYLLLGPPIGAATVFLIPWPDGLQVTVWQLASNPKSILPIYFFGAPSAAMVAAIDYGLRNYRWQWIYVVLGAALVCSVFYYAHGFWLVGVVPAGICSLLANYPRKQIGA